MKRLTLAIIFGLFVAGGIAARPVPVSALPAILPDCDQTVYYVGAGCSQSNPVVSPDCRKMTGGQFYDEFQTADARKSVNKVIVTNRQCGFNDFVRLFTNLASYGLAVLGALGVAVIVWGGFDLILAMGNQEKVQEGKKTIWGGLLGTFIVLIAFVMVRFFVDLLTGNTEGKLFAGTSSERFFYGEKCPTYSIECKKTITYNLKSTSEGKLAGRTGCRDNPKSNTHLVADVQQLLAQAGCYNDSIDGCFGPNSRQALEEFQSKNGIWPKAGGSSTGYGVTDDETWTALDKLKAGDTSVVGCEVPLTRTVSITLDAGSRPVLTPQTVAVQPNGSVRFYNDSSITVTFAFDQPLKAGGEPTVISIDTKKDTTLTFTEVGTYTYHDAIVIPGKTPAKGTVNVVYQ